MIPGMRGMSPKKLQQMMKQMGIEVEELEDVREIVIHLADKDLVFNNAQVTVMTAGGNKTYQITGEPVEKSSLNPDDVKLVAEQSGVSEDEAKNALMESNGDLAAAILRLTGKS